MMVVYGLLLKDDSVAELLCLIDEAVLAIIDETAFVIASPNDIRYKPFDLSLYGFTIFCDHPPIILNQYEHHQCVLIARSYL
jgi:hypothetical protein